MIRSASLLQLPQLPFCLGPQADPTNPFGLPDTLPFELIRNGTVGLLSQTRNSEVERCLAQAYATGSLLGPAMDDTSLGRPYAEDFAEYVNASLKGLQGRHILEIGSGRGYLLKLLGEKGGRVVGLEPGSANRSYWDKFGVKVVQGLFPADAPDGQFDAIVAYAVLEHIADPLDFLASIRRRLSVRGQCIISVPDCEPQIAASDSAMLFHEHFSYFEKTTLSALMRQAGFHVEDVRNAGYGGAIYCQGVVPEEADDTIAKQMSGTLESRTFRFQAVQNSVRQRLSNLESAGLKLGIFCALRAVPYLDAKAHVRFFDDDPELHGSYYPPFANPIEGRQGLIENPVDELWIMSRTFGPRLAVELAGVPSLNNCAIRLPDDVLGDC